MIDGRSSIQLDYKILFDWWSRITRKYEINVPKMEHKSSQFQNNKEPPMQVELSVDR